MSIERLDRKNGPVYRVRWRDENGAERSKVVGRKSDAEALDAEIKRGKRLGYTTEVGKHQFTLGKFVELWWSRYAVPHLSERTRKSYAGMWDRHVLPELGAVRLKDLTVDRVEDFAAHLRDKGVGEPTIYRLLMLVQGVVQRAVEWGYADRNHVRNVRKPSVKRNRTVRPLPEATVTAIIADLKRPRDKLIVSLMAHEGLRPQEITALMWQDFTEKGLIVDKASELDGKVKTTKTEQHRKVPLSDTTMALAHELLADRKVLGTERVITSTVKDKAFTDGMWNSWHRDVWNPMRKRLGITAPPYDLRHTFVSRLIDEGVNIIKIAKWAGHSPTMTMEVYGHLFDDD